MKQRLVGAAVLMALGVIFIPILLDPRSPETELETAPVVQFEPAPSFSSKVKPIDDELVENLSAALERAGEDSKELAISEAAQDSSTEPSAASEPAELNGKPSAATVRTGVSAWVVQIASFASKKNADSLIEKLKADGYTAYVDTISVEGKPNYRVRVGPELERIAAEQIRDRLNKQTKLEGMVVRYP